MIQLKAIVERVLFPREGQSGDWYILKTDAAICKGNCRWRPQPGERIAMAGNWSEYKGEQEFRFKEIWHDLPQDSRAMLRYACELTKGIGPKTEEEIWAALGDKWPEVKPGQIPKMRSATFVEFRETIQRLGIEKEKTDACTWLISHGATRRMAEAAWSMWEEKTIGVVKGDPYKLADLPNYGFRDVDGRIRREFGIGDYDTRRVCAAVCYFMRQLADGPTVVPWWALREKVTSATGLPYKIVCECVADMFRDGRLHPFPETQHIAIRSDYDNEKAIWDFALQEGAQ